MTNFIVDWGKSTKYVKEIAANYLKVDPLIIYTKDGFNFEMDARMIIQIDDDSIIMKNFRSFQDFVEARLNVLIRTFFSSRRKVDIVTNRLGFQEELVIVLQKELTEYGVKIQKFMIVYMLMPQFSIRKYISKGMGKMIEETHNVKGIKDISELKNDMNHIVLERMILLLILLSVAILLDILSLYFGYTTLAILGIIISITVTIMNIYQYLEIRKIRTKY